MFRRFILLPSSVNEMLSRLVITVGIFFARVVGSSTSWVAAKNNEIFYGISVCPGRGFKHKLSRRQKWVKYFRICRAKMYSDFKKIILKGEDPVYGPLKRRSDIIQQQLYCFRTKGRSFFVLRLMSSCGVTEGYLRRQYSPFTRRSLRAKAQWTWRYGRSDVTAFVYIYKNKTPWP